MDLSSFKKHLGLVIFALAVLAALVVIGVKLAGSLGHYNAEKRQLRDATGRKDLLTRRSPYPSLENVRREDEKYQDLLDGYNELNDALRARQIEPRGMQAVEFMSLLEKTVRQLGRQLAAARVAYPPNARFSFERYAGGKPPAREDVPRLVQQLGIIAALCQALGRAGVSELVAIGREEFENRAAPASARGRPATPAAGGAAGDDALFTTQHFYLTVRGREPALRSLLNLLAGFPVFTVVTSLELASLQPVLRAAAAPAAAGATHAAAGARDRAPITGNETIEMKLELDVYRFAPSLPFKESSGARR